MPAIRATGSANLTPNQLLTWLDQIHLRIARTLANDLQVESGKYSQQQVARWRQGADVKDALNVYLSGRMPPEINIIELAKQAGMDEHVAKEF